MTSKSLLVLSPSLLLLKGCPLAGEFGIFSQFLGAFVCKHQLLQCNPVPQFNKMAITSPEGFCLFSNCTINLSSQTENRKLWRNSVFLDNPTPRDGLYPLFGNRVPYLGTENRGERKRQQGCCFFSLPRTPSSLWKLLPLHPQARYLCKEPEGEQDEAVNHH